MPNKRGRPPTNDVECWPIEIAPHPELLSLEEEFFQALRTRNNLRSGRASTNLLEEWFGKKKSWHDSARSSWKKNRRRISPAAVPQNYLEALELSGDGLFPEIDTDNDRKYDADRKWWDSAEVKSYRDVLLKQFQLHLNRISDIQSPLKIPDEIVTNQERYVNANASMGAASGSIGSAFWRPIVQADFEAPFDQLSEIQSYLSGKQGVALWIARHGSVWRQDVVDRVRKRLSDLSVLTLHGPAGHGKSTVARQVVASVVEDGHPAVWLKSLLAFQDPELASFCLKSAGSTGEVFLLLDDVVLSVDLPPWIALDEGRRFKIIHTIQSRKLHLISRQLIGTKVGRFKVLSPQDLAPFVKNIVERGVGFSRSQNEVEAHFRAGFSNGNGGLWGATWAATKGESIDQRIQSIVDELFETESDWLTVSAIAFLCGVHEFDDRWKQSSTRSFVASIIKNHPDLDPEIAESAIKGLHRLREILGDELLNFSGDASIVDRLGDPVLEFRSSSVAHAFFRWIFGALTPPREHRLTRWPFYSAFAASLAEKDPDHPDLSRGLASLHASWDVGLRVRNDEIDHGRSGTDVAEIARTFLTSVLATDNAVWRNYRAAECYLLASKDPNCSEAGKQSLRSEAADRLLLSTAEYASSSSLSAVASLISRYDLPLLVEDQFVGPSDLFKRAIDRAKTPFEKSVQKVRFFSHVCHHQQDSIVGLRWDDIGGNDLEILAKSSYLPTIVRGYFDIVRNPKNRDKIEKFLSGEEFRRDIKNVVSVFGFFCSSIYAQKDLIDKLSKRTARVKPHRLEFYSDVAAIVEILNVVSLKQVPFGKVFGPILDDMRIRAFQAVVREGRYSEIVPWLRNTSINLPAQRDYEG